MSKSASTLRKVFWSLEVKLCGFESAHMGATQTPCLSSNVTVYGLCFYSLLPSARDKWPEATAHYANPSSEVPV